MFTVSAVAKLDRIMCQIWDRSNCVQTQLRCGAEPSTIAKRIVWQVCNQKKQVVAAAGRSAEASAAWQAVLIRIERQRGWKMPEERGWGGDRGAMPEAGLLERRGTPLPDGKASPLCVAAFMLPLDALLDGGACPARNQEHKLCGHKI